MSRRFPSPYDFDSDVDYYEAAYGVAEDEPEEGEEPEEGVDPIQAEAAWAAYLSAARASA